MDINTLIISSDEIIFIRWTVHTIQGIPRCLVPHQLDNLVMDNDITISPVLHDTYYNDKVVHNRLSLTKANYPESKVHGTNMGPTWVLSAPDGPHVGPMNLAIRIVISWSYQAKWAGICVCDCYCHWYYYCCHSHYHCQYHPWYQASWGQCGSRLGPIGPRWPPCWPHELCNLGQLLLTSRGYFCDPSFSPTV